MRNRKKKPDKIIQAGGREFHLYKYYDESLHEELINYPNFRENPEYTADGRPFALTVEEGCPHGKTNDPDDLHPYQCNECAYFQLEKPMDAIGVCMCEELRKNPEKT